MRACIRSAEKDLFGLKEKGLKCGNISIRLVSVTHAAVSGRRCASVPKHFIWLQKLDAFGNHLLSTRPKCWNLCNAFHGGQFREPRRVQGWMHEGYF